MTVGPGSEWSTTAVLPPGAPIANDDGELHALVNRARNTGEPIPVIALTGGSLWQTIGGASVVGRLHTEHARQYPIDLVRANTDSEQFWFVCALSAHSLRWNEFVAVMNTPWAGHFRWGHRSHPGDALVDITEGAKVGLNDWRNIVPRLRMGAHMPHPKLRERKCAEQSWTFPTARLVTADGQRRKRTRTLQVTVEPDALFVIA